MTSRVGAEIRGANCGKWDQGLGNELIAPETRTLRGTHVRCRERLGGLLRYYHRAA
jgi:hypothetical protein